MKKIIVFIFIATFAAITTWVHAEDATGDANTVKRVNPGTHPYLFFLEQNDWNGLIVYEQWAQKNPEDPSILTVMRTAGGKADIVNFSVKVEALKEGWCSFRILKHKDDDPTIAKAKELLGIKSDVFVIRFRDNPGQMSRTLLSVKDSHCSEKGGADQPATAPELEPEGKDKPKPEAEVRPR